MSAAAFSSSAHRSSCRVAILAAGKGGKVKDWSVPIRDYFTLGLGIFSQTPLLGGPKISVLVASVSPVPVVVILFMDVR